jgi:hypothetical protein
MKYKINMNDSINEILAPRFGHTEKTTRPKYKQQPGLITLCERLGSDIH